MSLSLQLAAGLKQMKAMVVGSAPSVAQTCPGSNLSQFNGCMRKLIVHITCNYSYCIIVLFLIIFLILQKINLCIIIK
jgi:hypothetical protein